jgi:hypothetical protein
MFGAGAVQGPCRGGAGSVPVIRQAGRRLVVGTHPGRGYRADTGRGSRPSGRGGRRPTGARRGSAGLAVWLLASRIAAVAARCGRRLPGW